MNEYFEEEPPKVKKPHVRRLGIYIELMSDADIVFFLDDWETSRECIIEHEVADKYGYLIIYERDLDYIDLNEVK